VLTAVRGEATDPRTGAAVEAPAAERLWAALAARLPAPPPLAAYLQANTSRLDAPAAFDPHLARVILSGLSPLLNAIRGPWSAVEFRRQALATGLGAAARVLPRQSELAATAFAGGMLAGIGQLALYAVFPKAYARVIATAPADAGGVRAAEQRVLGLDHEDATRRIAEAWDLPNNLRAALGHEGAAGEGEGRVLHTAIRRADLAARRAGIGWPDFVPLASPPDTDFPPPTCAELDALLARIDALEADIAIPNSPRTGQRINDSGASGPCGVTGPRARDAASSTTSWAPLLGALAAGAAHELNTPLANISGRVQMLKRDMTRPEHVQALAVIDENTRRASAIVSELLECAKPAAPRPAFVTLLAWAQCLRQHWQPRFAEKSAQIEVQLSDARLRAWVDAEQLTTAGHAVIANALAACPPHGGRVVINSRSQPTDETVVVSIGDNGCGMAPEVLAHACDPFFSHRVAGRGRGLGLSRTARLLEVNQGRMWIDSAAGSGTTVHFALPANAPSTRSSACGR